MTPPAAITENVKLEHYIGKTTATCEWQHSIQISLHLTRRTPIEFKGHAQKTDMLLTSPLSSERMVATSC